MYETRYHSLLPRRQFYERMARHIVLGLGLVAICLGIGMCGYHEFEKMGWTDAFVNAAMILSGMGPVSELKNDSGKVFAGCYALFSGLAFTVMVAIILAPAIHRALHKFHLEDAKLDKRAKN
jgi:hypothetical protein